MPNITLAFPPSRASAPVDYVTRMDAWLGGDLQNLVAQINSLDASDWFSVQSSPTDDTPGVLMINGAHGLGAESPVVIADIDDPASRTGFYRTSTSGSVGTFPNTPVNGILEVSRLDGNRQHQRLIPDLSSDITWTRIRNSGGWTAWQQSYGQRNILGTVSQSGGVPSGAAFEENSNANGHYERRASGVQICWAHLTPDWTSTATQTFTYPASFSGEVMGGVLGMRNGASSAGSRLRSLTNFGCSTQWFLTVDGTSPNDADPSRNEIAVYAIGRWF